MKFQALTSTAEPLGFFDDHSRISFHNQWRNWSLKEAIVLIDNEFASPGNDFSEIGGISESYTAIVDEVQRYLALVRYGFSAPIQMLARFGFLDRSHNVFDYG